MFSDRLIIKGGARLDEDEKSYVNRIQDIGKKMQELINDILEFSKISSVNKKMVEVDMNQLVRDVVLDMDASIQEKHADVIVEEIPQLAVNPVLIKPLFQNLIGNSLKYSRKKVNPVIRIHSDNSAALQGDHPKNNGVTYCRIFVEDNGIGFDQKYSEEIFDMFRRLHPRAEYEGTGIGLALCKRIVEKHNGFISARSKPGEGATFIISLPREKTRVIE